MSLIGNIKPGLRPLSVGRHFTAEAAGQRLDTDDATSDHLSNATSSPGTNHGSGSFYRCARFRAGGSDPRGAKRAAVPLDAPASLVAPSAPSERFFNRPSKPLYQ